MAKIRNPARFSSHFGVSPADLSKLGIMNPTLNVDTELFIDPLLLEESGHQELRDARKTYETYFLQVGTFLGAIAKENDVAWKSATRLLSFREVKGTCLGYGADSISGSGAGPATTLRLLLTGKEIMDLGISHPDLFVAMALFEKDFGPDLVSDMTTNIIIEHLIAFNDRVLDQLGLAGSEIEIKLANAKKYPAKLMLNPFFDEDVPVILVPQDILRPLPVSTCWADVSEAARENEELRENLSADISNMWARKTLDSKEKLKNWALGDSSAFSMLLEMLHGSSPKPYDFVSDPLGELVWRTKGVRSQQNSRSISQSPQPTTPIQLTV